MNQIAVVTEIYGDGTAQVETSRRTMCDFCERGADCGSHGCELTGMLSRGKPMKARALNEIGARAGDVVELDTPSGKVLAYAAAVFLAPIIIGLAVFVLTACLAGNTAAFIASAASFVLTFAVIYFTMERRARKKPDVVITAIKRSAPETQTEPEADEPDVK